MLLPLIMNSDNQLETELFALGEKRTIFYTSIEDWFSDFRYSFIRDMAYNVGKIAALSLLHYFAPNVVTWLSNTFNVT